MSKWCRGVASTDVVKERRYHVNANKIPDGKLYGSVDGGSKASVNERMNIEELKGAIVSGTEDTKR